MSFDKLQDDVSAICEKERPSLNDKDDLFHYTDCIALINILKENELWLTQREFMNDVYEMSYANRTLKKAFIDIYGTSGEQEFNDFVNRNLPDFHKKYIFSLTTENDLLGQWVYYGKNDGYSLKFNVKEIFSYFKSSGYGIETGNIVYNEKNQLDIFKHILNYYNKINFAIAANPSNMTLIDYLSKANSLLVLYHSLIKQENNYCEKEYRIVVNNIDNLDFRSGNGVVTPYTIVKKDKVELPIKEIMIGPRISDIIAEDGLKQFIDSLNRKALIQVNSSSMKIR